MNCLKNCGILLYARKEQLNLRSHASRPLLGWRTSQELGFANIKYYAKVIIACKDEADRKLIFKGLNRQDPEVHEPEQKRGEKA